MFPFHAPSPPHASLPLGSTLGCKGSSVSPFGLSLSLHHLLIFPRGEKGILPFLAFPIWCIRFLYIFHLGMEGVGGSSPFKWQGEGGFLGPICLAFLLEALGNYIF